MEREREKGRVETRSGVVEKSAKPSRAEGEAQQRCVEVCVTEKSSVSGETQQSLRRCDRQLGVSVLYSKKNQKLTTTTTTGKNPTMLQFTVAEYQFFM